MPAGLPSIASAAEAERLVLIAEPDAPLTLQVAADLETMGFQVAVQSEGTSDESTVTSRLKELQGGAAVLLEQQEDGVRLRVYDRRRGAWREHQIKSSPNARDGVVATQVVEALRATLMAPEPRPSASPPQVPTAASPPPEGRRSPGTVRLSVAAGIATVAAPRATPGLEANVAVQAVHVKSVGFGGRVLLRLPLSAASLSGSGGAADVRTLGVAPMGLLELAPGDRISGDVGAGASIDWIAVRGNAAESFEGQSSSALGISPAASASLAIRLLPRVGLRAHGLAGYLLPPTNVSFADGGTVRWGAPWVSAGLWLTWSNG